MSQSWRIADKLHWVRFSNESWFPQGQKERLICFSCRKHWKWFYIPQAPQIGASWSIVAHTATITVAWQRLPPYWWHPINSRICSIRTVDLKQNSLVLFHLSSDLLENLQGSVWWRASAALLAAFWVPRDALLLLLQNDIHWFHVTWRCQTFQAEALFLLLFIHSLSLLLQFPIDAPCQVLGPSM